MRIVSEKLTYTYDAKTPFPARALRGVDLVIEEGEFCGIIGHTGSGKSTLVQHLNGLIRVDKGCIAAGGKLSVGDFDLTDKKCDLRLLRSKVGMVFQYPEYQLFAENCFNDVAFGYKNFNKDASEADVERAVKEAIETVGLSYSAVKDKSPFDLSGGQKRRVAIAGVLVTKPEILVLDEPCAGLDPQGKKDMFALLHELHNGWCKTIVLVSHDMDDVAQHCSTVAVLSGGKVVARGAPQDVFAQTEWLLGMGLDVPETAKLTMRLGRCGVDVKNDYTTDGFCTALLDKYNKRNQPKDN